MEKIVGITIAIVGILVILVGLSLLLAWPFMLLWNGCLVGTVAGVSPLTSIWHSWGILILASFLFKSTGVTKSRDLLGGYRREQTPEAQSVRNC